MKDSTVDARVENNVNIPFSLTLPSEPRTIDAMSDAELDAKLQHSYTPSLAGEGRPMNEVFDDRERSTADEMSQMRKRYESRLFANVKDGRI